VARRTTAPNQATITDVDLFAGHSAQARKSSNLPPASRLQVMAIQLQFRENCPRSFAARRGIFVKTRKPKKDIQIEDSLVALHTLDMSMIQTDSK